MDYLRFCHLLLACSPRLEGNGRQISDLFEEQVLQFSGSHPRDAALEFRPSPQDSRTFDGPSALMTRGLLQLLQEILSTARISARVLGISNGQRAQRSLGIWSLLAKRTLTSRIHSGILAFRLHVGRSDSARPRFEPIQFLTRSRAERAATNRSDNRFNNCRRHPANRVRARDRDRSRFGSATGPRVAGTFATWPSKNLSGERRRSFRVWPSVSMAALR
jgi:hypothetical protein